MVKYMCVCVCVIEIPLISFFLEIVYDMPRLTHDQRVEIVTLSKTGVLGKDLAKQYQVRENTICDLLRKERLSGTVDDMRKSGRPRCSSSRDDRNLAIDALRHPRVGSRELKRRWQINLGKAVSIRTVQTRLISAGVRSYVCKKKPLISKVNMSRRLQWAKDHEQWGDNEWRQVLFSDETPLYLIQTTQRRYFRSRQISHDKRINAATTRPTVQAGGGKIMVWGAFRSDIIVPLRRVNGTLRSQQYTEILQERVLPHLNAHPHPSLIFQQDNAPSHTSIHTRSWLQQHGMQVMQWPPQSPDLNPVENLWNNLKQRLELSEIHGFDNLWETAQKLWMETSTCIMNNLIASMPRRVQAVLRNRGGPTRY
jgi:hypothetical protein